MDLVRLSVPHTTRHGCTPALDRSGAPPSCGSHKDRKHTEVSQSVISRLVHRFRDTGSAGDTPKRIDTVTEMMAVNAAGGIEVSEMPNVVPKYRYGGGGVTVNAAKNWSGYHKWDCDWPILPPGYHKSNYYSTTSSICTKFHLYGWQRAPAPC